MRCFKHVRQGGGSRKDPRHIGEMSLKEFGHISPSYQMSWKRKSGHLSQTAAPTSQNGISGRKWMGGIISQEWPQIIFPFVSKLITLKLHESKRWRTSLTYILFSIFQTVVSLNWKMSFWKYPVIINTGIATHSDEQLTLKKKKSLATDRLVPTEYCGVHYKASSTQPGRHCVSLLDKT